MRLKKIPRAMAYLTEDNNVDVLTKEWEQEITDNGDKPIEIEIGCGKGDFILKKARENPQTMFYAIEKFDSVLFRAVEKFNEQPVDNLRYVLGDAEYLDLYFPTDILSCIYLNFSDPWPKKRHAKRRLTYRDKLRLYERLLVKSGRIEIKTDNQSLFESTIKEMSLEQWQLAEVSVNLYENDDLHEKTFCQTEYEKKFTAKGQAIHYIEAYKNR